MAGLANADHWRIFAELMVTGKRYMTKMDGFDPLMGREKLFIYNGAHPQFAFARTSAC